MKKLVFDFDGTLVDSMPAFSDTMLTVLKNNNVEYPDNVIEIITPLGYHGTTKYFIEELGMQKSVDKVFSEIAELAIRAYTYDIPAKETVAETLNELRRRGYSLNVLTASPHVMLDVCLKRNELYELFDNVWSCDDFGTTKADPKIYHAVAERLGTTVENCVFFDDNINADRTAKEAGMEVVGVYDDSSKDCTEEIKAVADHYIYKFDEIFGILK